MTKPSNCRFKTIIILLSCMLTAGIQAEDIIEYRYQVIEQYPHATDIFTQGLEIREGRLLESGGQYAQSSLSTRSLSSIKPLQHHRLDAEFFAEGISQLNGLIYQLTWQSGIVFVYHADSFKPLKTFSIEGEGWGLSNNGEQLIMSNGSSSLFFIDPATFEIQRTLAVTHQGRPLPRLNELEWVEGLIYANVWRSDWIVMIDPDSGRVVGQVNLKALKPAGANVLNGIAYDKDQQRLLVTGKYWPRLYHIKLFNRPE